MNMQIFLNKGPRPVIGLEEQRLTDGSVVSNLVIHPSTEPTIIPMNSIALGENAIFIISEIIRQSSNELVVLA